MLGGGAGTKVGGGPGWQDIMLGGSVGTAVMSSASSCCLICVWPLFLSRVESRSGSSGPRPTTLFVVLLRYASLICSFFFLSPPFLTATGSTVFFGGVALADFFPKQHPRSANTGKAVVMKNIKMKGSFVAAAIRSIVD